MIKINSKRSLIVGAIAFASIILSGCNLYNTPSSQSGKEQGSQVQSDVNVISYSNSGFSPAELKIKVGNTLTFKNDSNTVIQVNSAPHPAHTSFPELNLGQIAPGDTKTVTFTGTGTRKYHNHLDASKFGTIVVE